MSENPKIELQPITAGDGFPGASITITATGVHINLVLTALEASRVSSGLQRILRDNIKYIKVQGSHYLETK